MSEFVDVPSPPSPLLAAAAPHEDDDNRVHPVRMFYLESVDDDDDDDDDATSSTETNNHNDPPPAVAAEDEPDVEQGGGGSGGIGNVSLHGEAEITLERLRALLQEMEQGDQTDNDLGMDGDDNNDEDDRGTCCASCWDFSGRLVCVPIAFVVTVATVTMVISFCVLPSIILIGTALACYYCCTNEPIPVRVLLRAMLYDDMELSGAPTVTRTKAEIHDLLLRRECLAVTKPGNEKEKGDDTTIFVVDTKDRKLIFSEPLAKQSLSGKPPEKTDDDGRASILDDDESNEIELAPMNLGTTVEDDVETGLATIRSDREEKEEEKEELSEINLCRHNNIENSIGSSVSPNDALPAINEGDDNDKSSVPTPNLEAPAHCASDEFNPRPIPADMINDNLSESSSMMHHERGTACDICLRLYRPGDIVAWSHNPACDHAYHCDCITDWLMHGNSKGNSCPNCRSDFLYAAAQQQQNSNGSRSSRRRRGRTSSNANNDDDAVQSESLSSA